MNHDILKRLGLDHLDVQSPDFLDALNRMQQDERDGLRRAEPLNDPEFATGDELVPCPGFDWMPFPQ
jgi:hypothetical protein